MMRLVRLTALIALASLVVPGAGANSARAVSIPVEVSGSVQVDFASSAAAGCELRCGPSASLAGSLTWDPGGQADLEVTERRAGARRELDASLVFLGGAGQDAPTTTAHVVRDAAGGAPAVCSDVRVNDLTFLDFSAGSPSHVEARLLKGGPDDSNLFRTRCGGPLEPDLVGALPSAKMDLATFTRGRVTVDLSGTRQFAARGFTGTVRSSIELRLGRFATDLPPPLEVTSRRLPGYAPRSVIARYRIEHVAGSIETSFTGGTELPLCNPLDSCGAFGTLRLSPMVSAGRATFVAYGPAKRVSGGELRAVLGLRRGPRVRGVTASGVADWSRDGGSLSESFTGGDGTVCNDTIPLASGFMTFWVGPRRVFATYGRSSAGGPDLLRTHCPGPSILDAAQDHPLATGSVPRNSFGKSRVVITLTRGRPFDSEPYAGDTRPALTIVLRRVAVRERLGFDVLNEL
jgi:hypothetical protein